MKKSVWALLILIALVVSVGCGAEAMQPTTGERIISVSTQTEVPFIQVTANGVNWTVPREMDVATYPILPYSKNRRLTEDQVIAMGLRLDTVPAGTVLWNEDPGHKAFWLDTMRRPRNVWRNRAGEVVYIADCGNRAMEPKLSSTCPPNVICPGPHIADKGVVGTSGTTNGGSDGNTSNSSYGVPGWLKSFWNFLGNLFLLLLALALIALLIALAILFVRWLVDALRGAGTQPAPVPTPVVRPRRFIGPRPVAPVPPAVAPPAPQPEATFQRFGPYDHIAIDDAGAEGYRVSGFNGNVEVPLGTFRWAQTENAGDHGEYVVVMI